MEWNKDFRDLCALLNANNVDYLIVGGYAVAFHGAPRFTGDIDLLIHPSEESVSRALSAIRQFGFPTEQVRAAQLLDSRTILELGREPCQVHIMTSISGISWDTAWDSRQSGSFMDVTVFYLGREELIANKRACRRAKDLADVEALTRRPRDSS
jgi:hypothetical protein